MVPSPPAAQLLSAGSLIQRTIDVFHRQATVLLWCVVTVVVPLTVVSGAAAVLIGPGGRRTYAIGIVLMALVAAFGGLVALGACMRVAVRDGSGEPVTVQDALTFGVRRYLMVLGVTAVVGVGLCVGFLACFLPAIYLFVRWATAVPALIIEGGGVTDVMRRSWHLVERRWWMTFGLLLLGYLLPGVVALVLQQVVVALFGIASDPQTPEALLGQGVAQVVGVCLTTPFTAIFLVLLFQDLAATEAPAVRQEPAWPPPVAPSVPRAPTPPAAPPPAPPALPDGFLPPAPDAPPRSGGLAPPPERPPGAGD